MADDRVCGSREEERVACRCCSHLRLGCVCGGPCAGAVSRPLGEGGEDGLGGVLGLLLMIPGRIAASAVAGINGMRIACAWGMMAADGGGRLGRGPGCCRRPPLARTPAVSPSVSRRPHGAFKTVEARARTVFFIASVLEISLPAARNVGRLLEPIPGHGHHRDARAPVPHAALYRSPLVVQPKRDVAERERGEGGGNIQPSHRLYWSRWTTRLCVPSLVCTLPKIERVLMKI